MAHQPTNAKGRKVAILVADGVDSQQVNALKEALSQAGAQCELVGPHLGDINGQGGQLEAKKTYANTSSVLYDAVFAPGGSGMDTLTRKGDAHVFLAQAYKHGKPVAAAGESVTLLTDSLPEGAIDADAGVFTQTDSNAQATIEQFVNAVGQRYWQRSSVEMVAA